MIIFFSSSMDSELVVSLSMLSKSLNSNIVPLFEKILSASDAGRIGRLVLPKACAEVSLKLYSLCPFPVPFFFWLCFPICFCICVRFKPLQAYFPPVSQSEGIPLRIQDIKGREWTFQFRFWPNNNSRMYVLEGVTPCIHSMQLKAGDTSMINYILA